MEPVVPVVPILPVVLLVPEVPLALVEPAVDPAAPTLPLAPGVIAEVPVVVLGFVVEVPLAWQAFDLPEPAGCVGWGDLPP